MSIKMFYLFTYLVTWVDLIRMHKLCSDMATMYFSVFQEIA